MEHLVRYMFLLFVSQVWSFICGGAFDQLEAISPEFKTLSSSWYCYHGGAQAGNFYSGGMSGMHLCTLWA
jgi:hypothetical protein